MASVREPIGDIIMKQLLSTQELISTNPAVLSCGGIYIPRRAEEARILYHIITTSNREEPVKIMTGITRPRNALYEVLMKESLN